MNCQTCQNETKTTDSATPNASAPHAPPFQVGSIFSPREQFANMFAEILTASVPAFAVFLADLAMPRPTFRLKPQRKPLGARVALGVADRLYRTGAAVRAFVKTYAEAHQEMDSRVLEAVRSGAFTPELDDVAEPIAGIDDDPEARARAPFEGLNGVAPAPAAAHS